MHQNSKFNKPIKLLEGSIDVNIYNLALGNGFQDITLKAQATKEILDKLDFIQIKNFYVSKEESEKTTYKIGKNIHKSHI